MKHTILILSTLFYFLSYSQFNIMEETDATILAQQLAGTGVNISNATLVCPTAPITGEAFSGTFSGADPSLGIAEGVLLTTGIVTTVNDTAGSITRISESGDDVGDTDLDDLLTDLGETYTTNDACVLEFDINVIGDTLRFNYAMGSEEYPNFVCGTVNDIFGFFISGPNPAGGNYINQNLALIPGTNIPVSINTVNNGGTAIGAATCYNGTYSNFMNTNTTPISAVPNIAYNQITQVLQAKTATVPCAQYHFKLAIADGGDWAFDSGVFLEAGSFSSTGVIVGTSTILGQGFNTMVESCIDGEIEFILEDGPNNTGSPISIQYNFTGDATHLLDYYNLPLQDSVIIQPGDSTATVQLFALPDGISEGVETIEVNIETACGFIQATTMQISDVIPFNVLPYDDSLCIGESIDFEVTGAQTYSWSPTTGVSDPNSGTTTLSPTSTTTYTVSYTLGNCSDDSTFTIYVSDLTASLTVTDETCPEDNDGTAFITYQNGIGNVSFSWNDGNMDSSRTNLQAANYCATISDEGGCDITLCDDINELSLFVFLSAADIELCPGDSTTIQVFSGLGANATYQWGPSNLLDNPNSNFIVNTTPIPSTTTFYVVGTDQGCSVSDSIEIALNDLQASLNTTDVSCSGQNDGSITVTASSTNGGPFYLWDDNSTNPTIGNLSTGNYCVEVSDFSCFITLCDDVEENATFNLSLSADDTILCNIDSTIITIDTDLQNGTFIWSPAQNFNNTNAQNQNTAINLQASTTISVKATDSNNCEQSSSITIDAKKLVVNANYTDTTVAHGSTNDIGVTIASQDNINGVVNFEWSPAMFLASTSSENTTTTPTDNIVYTISSEADGCTDIDSIKVNIITELEMPTAFTPNGDGLNDTYSPIATGGKIVAFRIYNRWSDLLYNNVEANWDGTVKSQLQGNEVYFYYIEIQNGDNTVKQSGSFTLIH